MLSEFLRKEIPTLLKNDIRFLPLGRWRELPAETVDDIEAAIAATAACGKLLFQVALNYSGRAEIVDICRNIARAAARGEIAAESIDEAVFAAHLYNPSVPDPDLLIRTSGEQRISNFLLWEIAYTELFITPTFWPDFRLRHLLEAIIDFQGRERRFGGLNGGDLP
jgi:undecaprenyl diphosphate synthase